MRRAQHGAATMRAVGWSLVVALLVTGAAAWWARTAIVEGEKKALPAIPPARVIEALPAEAPVQAVVVRDPLEALWCEKGPEAVVQATRMLQEDGNEAAASEASMQHALLRCEALLAQGQVETALELNRRMWAALARPTPAQALEPLVLEQHARLRMAGGETNMLKQEERLKASVEARQMLGGEVPVPAWATLGALQKARGDCGAAVESYGRALMGMSDAPSWVRLRSEAPWRLELLALVAMDRADCLASNGDAAGARKAAIAIAADLAAAFGESDPLSQQAADLRDLLTRAP